MYFLILGHDKPGMLKTRQDIRPSHLDYIRRDDLPARIVAGAPMAEDDGETMNGTWLVVEAADRAAAEEFAQGDPYYQAGIFASHEVWTVHSQFQASKFLRLVD